MQQVYTLQEAKAQGDQAVFSIENGKVLVTTEGSRFIEVESNVWAKVSGESSALTALRNLKDKGAGDITLDNIRYVSASSHSGGVVVRPLYICLDGQWINISTGKKAVFTELA